MALRTFVRLNRLCSRNLTPGIHCPLFSVCHKNSRALDLSAASSCYPIQHQQDFHTTSHKRHGEYEWKDPEKEEDVVMITVHNKEGKVNRVRGKIGDNLLYLCKRFEVDMEGACEASLACTTCHVYVDHEFLDLLPPATETEEDLLDQAPFLRDNSRLGCQIILSKEYDGMVLRLPAATKNFYVDGHKPSHH